MSSLLGGGDSCGGSSSLLCDLVWACCGFLLRCVGYSSLLCVCSSVLRLGPFLLSSTGSRLLQVSCSGPCLGWDMPVAFDDGWMPEAPLCMCGWRFGAVLLDVYLSYNGASALTALSDGSWFVLGGALAAFSWFVG